MLLIFFSTLVWLCHFFELHFGISSFLTQTCWLHLFILWVYGFRTHLGSKSQNMRSCTLEASLPHPIYLLPPIPITSVGSKSHELLVHPSWLIIFCTYAQIFFALFLCFLYKRWRAVLVPYSCRNNVLQTKCGLNNRHLLSHSSWDRRRRSRCWQSHAPFKGTREGSDSGISPSSWQHNSSLHLAFFLIYAVNAVLRFVICCSMFSRVCMCPNFTLGVQFQPTPSVSTCISLD